MLRLKHSEHLSLDVRDLDAASWRRSVGGILQCGCSKTVQTLELSVCQLECVRDLSDSELASPIVGQVQRTAEDALVIIQIKDFVGSRGSEMVWQILDQAQAKQIGDKSDVPCEDWDSARRRHGQSMHDWIMYLRRAMFDAVIHLGSDDGNNVWEQYTERCSRRCTRWRREREKQL